MGTLFFKSGKDKAAKREGWAALFICCALDTLGLKPTAPRLRDILPLAYYVRRESFVHLSETVIKQYKNSLLAKKEG